MLRNVSRQAWECDFKLSKFDFKVIDLTLPISETFRFSGNHHATGHGTYIDAPAYLGAGKTIDQFGLEAFVMDAVILDLTSKKPKQPIDDEDLEAAEEAAGLALREGEIAIIHTGWDQSHTGKSRSDHSYLSENGAEYLEFKHVVAVGVDTPNLDNPKKREIPVHTKLLRKEILILEGLSNLDMVDQSRFRLVALPLRVKASFSPVRAAAIALDAR